MDPGRPLRLAGAPSPIPRGHRSGRATSAGHLARSGRTGWTGWTGPGQDLRRPGRYPTVSPKPFYTVVATHAGKWWTVEVPEVIGALARAEDESQIEHVARGVIALMLDVDERSFDLVITGT
jgi:hypothetical protein